MQFHLQPAASGEGAHPYLFRPGSAAIGHDLARSSLVRQSLLEFRRVTGLAAKLVPPGIPARLVRFGPQDNELCRAVACNPEGCRDCYEAQVKLLRRLGNKLKPQQVCCQGGLVLLAVPIVVAGQHAGTILGGKVRAGCGRENAFEAMIPVLRRQHRGADLRRLRTAHYGVPALSASQLRSAVRLLDMLARLFAEILARPPAPHPSSDPACVIEARQFVRLHLAERFSTRDAAQAMHLSVSYFCRRFHRLGGMTFHEFVAQERVQAASHSLRTTHQRIGEIAFATGFQSLSDFNRVFKVHTGLTPTDFRQEAA
jgi:AraC-like DNA-binding protein/ligand-binding sensor protein